MLAAHNNNKKWLSNLTNTQFCAFYSASAKENIFNFI